MGVRPERHGAWHNLMPARPGEGVPIQEHFAAHGYHTAYVGKVYEPAFAERFAWDEVPEPVLASGQRLQVQVRERGMGPEGWWFVADTTDSEEIDGFNARLASELVPRPLEEPFFLAVGLYKPHLRWAAPRRYFDLYDAADMTFDPAPADDLADVPAIAVRRRPRKLPGTTLFGSEPRGLRPDPGLRREALAAYFACVTFVDAQVGVLLEALDRHGLWEDTVVVLVGDHGYHLGEHRGMWRKDTLFEEALRTPLIVAAPGIPRPGEPSRSLAELLDVYPTLLELTGLPDPGGLDGVSLAPALRDPSHRVRSAARSYRRVEAPRLGASVRDGRWRLTQWPDGSLELYDLVDDPGTRRNLSAELEDVASRLRGLLAENALR
jgi:uncharacterized sulfatase